MKKYFLNRILLLFVWMGIAFTAQAQNANIRGFIYDNSNGEPMIFTNIYLEGTTVGATTDDNGFFSITKVQAGDYKLIVAALGFDTMRADVHVVGNEIITKKLYVNKGSIKLKEVHISAEKQEAKTEVRVSVNRIMPKEIKQLPTIGGEPELAQYLQIIPGVVSSGDQGGQMYIRGGSPIQNKVLMDGMVLYNPFHSIGLFSVFDSDIIRSADVYSGGFNAELGGRISSVIDITTRDGNKKKLSGKISANTFTSKLLLELMEKLFTSVDNYKLFVDNNEKIGKESYKNICDSNTNILIIDMHGVTIPSLFKLPDNVNIVFLSPISYITCTNLSYINDNILK